MVFQRNNKGIKSITVIGKNGNIVSSDKNNDMKISENMMKEKMDYFLLTEWME